jgi:hypothetical protein
VRVIGFPWVPGNARYGETGFVAATTRLEGNWNFDRSRFIEVFAEASRKCGGLGCIGVFARFNYLDGKGTAHPTLHIGGIEEVFPEFDFTINRSSWTLGGKVSLDFALPGLPNFGLYF